MFLTQDGVVLFGGKCASCVKRLEQHPDRNVSRYLFVVVCSLLTALL